MVPDGPAQTFTYMLLGYAAILACVAFVVFSLAMRYRRLKRELHLLQDLQERGED